ncbi:MAG: hypothetical protein AAF434_01185 [Pseudomonadota bacterium]
MDINTLLAVFGGAQVAVVALVVYLGRLWLKRFELELTQTLEKSKHVSQAQFDREFSFYQELWTHVSNLRKAIRDTILPFNSIIETDSNAIISNKELRQNCQNLILKSEEFWIFVESNKPFFPTEMIEYLDSLRNDSYVWGSELIEMKSLNSDWYLTKGSVKLQELNATVNSLEQIIRVRLKNLGGLN